MGGGWFPKLVWPKHNMINQQVKVGVANNDKRARCWCGTGKVGVATTTPAIRHSPPMAGGAYVAFGCMQCILYDCLTYCMQVACRAQLLSLFPGRIWSIYLACISFENIHEKNKVY